MHDEAEYFATHCAACGKKDGRLVYIACGECFHPYLTPLGLVLADWKIHWLIWWRNRGPDPLFNSRFHWKMLFPRRLKKIYCCPCCAHDL